MTKMFVFLIKLLDRVASGLIKKIQNEEARCFFTVWDLALKGAWCEFSTPMMDYIHHGINKFGGCSLQIYWAYKNMPNISDKVVYLVSPSKIEAIDSLDGHWMNIHGSGLLFIDGYGNLVDARKVGEVIYLNNKKFYVARICHIDNVAPNLGVNHILCQLYRFIYWLKDNGGWQ